MRVKEETSARRSTLENAIVAARESDLLEEHVPQYRKTLLGSCFNGFHRVLTEEPPADAEPMQMTAIPGVDLSQVKAKPRMHPPEKVRASISRSRSFALRGWCTRLWKWFARVSRLVSKGCGGYRMVADLRETNHLCKPVPAPMANMEKMAQMCAGVNVFCTLDILQGYWQDPLRKEDHEFFLRS